MINYKALEQELLKKKTTNCKLLYYSSITIRINLNKQSCSDVPSSLNQRGDAADAVIFVFNWISDHLLYFVQRPCFDPDLSPCREKGSQSGYTISLLRGPINGHRWTGCTYTQALAPLPSFNLFMCTLNCHEKIYCTQGKFCFQNFFYTYKDRYLYK